MATLLAEWSLARVPEFRAAVALSQTALAERVGLSRPTMAKIESGETTKLSTVNFLVTRLQEEFDDLFESIELREISPNAYELYFVKKEPPEKNRKARPVPSWANELNALAGKVMEVTRARNADHLHLFHDELLDILESYVKLSGLEISVKSE